MYDKLHHIISFNSPNVHPASIEGFEDYQCEQNILLATLLLLEVYNFANLALFEPMLALCMLPVISADIFMMTLTDDGEEPEWESDCTTVCGDEMEYEQMDYGSETEPLLREWMVEQQPLSDSISQIGDDDDDDGDDDESSFSTSSTVNNLFITTWSGSSDSDYDSDSSIASGHTISISLNSGYSGD
ncbi:hypothetical protein ACSS6W_007163 [Trichoderma asperelloides]